MKITDYDTVMQAAMEAIDIHDWDIRSYLSDDALCNFMTSFYMLSPESKSIELHQGYCSLICSPTRVSIILDKHTNYHKDDNGIFTYGNLDADLYNFLCITQLLLQTLQ